jgi:outer membrane DcaP-like protein
MSAIRGGKPARGLGRFLASRRCREATIRTYAAIVAGLWLLGSTASAQTPPTVDDLLRLIDAQQKSIDEQRQRLDALQKQLDDLRATPAPATAPTAQSKTTPEARGQRPESPADVVRAGEFPGSLRIPGSDAAFKIGGLVRVNWVTTLNPLLVTDRFITADIPVDVVNAPVGGRVDVMAIPSRFNLDFRTPTGVGYMRAYVEADFAGSGNTLRLRHAFGQWRNLLFGQTWSTFSDPEAEPDGIDFEGLNAISRFRQPQARWTWPSSGHLRFAFALENPDVEIANLTGADRRPDFIARLRWQAEHEQHLQAAVLFRQLQGFPSNVSSDIVATNGWGVTASGRWPSFVWRTDDRILFQVIRGEGIGHYITDLSSAGDQDGVFDPATNTVHALAALSGFVSYEHWWTERFHSAFTAGSVLVRNLEIQPADAYHMTRRYSINFIWSPIPRLDLVAEFLAGIRINKDEHRERASQIQIGSTFRF